MNLLFHAVQPDFGVKGDLDWDEFLREASVVRLPDTAEQLAPNVWLLPTRNDRTYLELAQIGVRHGIETRTLSFAHAPTWQRLSPPS